MRCTNGISFVLFYVFDSCANKFVGRSVALSPCEHEYTVILVEGTYTDERLDNLL